MVSEDHLFVYFEDDPLSRIVMELLLVRRLGFENVIIHEDSSDFMNKIRNLPKLPSIVFLDVYMEPHNGFEMLDMLRHSTHHLNLTVIAVTASVMNDEILMLKDAGFDGAISKPINQDIFADHLEQILDGHSVWAIS